MRCTRVPEHFLEFELRAKLFEVNPNTHVESFVEGEMKKVSAKKVFVTSARSQQITCAAFEYRPSSHHMEVEKKNRNPRWGTFTQTGSILPTGLIHPIKKHTYSSYLFVIPIHHT